VSQNLLAGTVAESELDLAAEKFEESKELAETAMINLLENEVCFYSMLGKSFRGL